MAAAFAVWLALDSGYLWAWAAVYGAIVAGGAFVATRGQTYAGSIWRARRAIL